MEKFHKFRRGKVVLFFASFFTLMILVFMACRKDLNQPNIESKMTLSVGTRQKLEVPKNEINFIHNVVPPASLAYPRFGIYTNCSPIYDIECHCLHNTVHVQNNNITNDNRGSVVTNIFNNSPNHYYYKEGIAITYVPIHK